ncbi:MAG TPA: ABC transporter permease [Pyrinomonadaceae bacterium]|nr:ABC transporter permease [Pyrinomonadaceae bacterium]
MDSLITANIRQRPVRTVVCVAGIALGVCLVMLFTGLATGLSNDLQRRNSNLHAEILFTRPGAMQLMVSTPSLSTEYVERIKAIDGVSEAIPVAAYIFTDSNRAFGLERVDGVDWEPISKLNGLRLISGRPPQAFDEIVIDEIKAKNGNYSPGSVVKLFGKRQYRVTGVYSPESGARVKMTLAAMQDALEAPNKCTYILIKVREPLKEAELAKRIDTALPGNKVQFTRDVFKSVETTIPALGVFLRTLVGLAAIISILVVLLAMYTTITERTKEIGILKALGASRIYIVSVIEKEALVISVMGLIIGFAASFLAGLLIKSFFGLVFEYTWKWALTAALIGMFGGAVGALYPALRASNLDPVNALSYD